MRMPFAAQVVSHTPEHVAMGAPVNDVTKLLYSYSSIPGSVTWPTRPVLQYFPFRQDVDLILSILFLCKSLCLAVVLSRLLFEKGLVS